MSRNPFDYLHNAPEYVQTTHGKRQSKPKPKAQQKIDYLLVIDFEATCEKDRHDWNHEIIEFPIIMLNTRTLQIDDEFHSYVRPTEVPKLTAFCTELTGITQDKVDSADTLPIVLQRVDDWLKSKSLKYYQDAQPGDLSFIFGTDGPWDFFNFLRKELRRLDMPIPPYYSVFLDIRKAFPGVLKTKRKNVNGMLQHLKLSFEGRPHSGLDDARNIARIAKGLIENNFVVWPNEKLERKSIIEE